MKNIILLLFFIFPVIPISAQKQYFSITGKTFGKEYIIPDRMTTDPLPRTYIQIKEIPKQGWLSDTEGYFRIDSLQSGKYHLTFSYIGFEYVDTIIAINKDIQNLQIILFDFSVSNPQLRLILSKEEENQILQNAFWNKYKLRAAWNTKEFLQNKTQRITASDYYYDLKRNKIIFDYLDKKHGYSWRFEAPKGIIGLDETLDSYEIFTK